MTAALQIIAVGIGTYLIRVSAIALAGRFGQPSPDVRATMRLIGPAVLAAIVADQLVVDESALTIRPSWLLSALIAGWVAWRWRSAGLTMGVGMLAVWLLQSAGLT